MSGDGEKCYSATRNVAILCWVEKLLRMYYYSTQRKPYLLDGENIRHLSKYKSFQAALPTNTTRSKVYIHQQGEYKYKPDDSRNN
jgi:hypothetical protein